MPHPPFASRLTNFLRDANNGITAPSAAGTDSELNAILNSLNLSILRLRAITSADGNLINFAAATAQALAGTQDFTATAAQTAFTTTIAWTAAFTSSNVFVYVNNVKLATSAVTVADSGGFLRVTIAAQSAGVIVTVAAFESGAGLLSRLQTVSATQGASLIALNDAAGLFVAVTVEAALAEVMTSLNTLITNVGATAGLIRSNGTVPFAAAQSMGGFKLTNLADGTVATDAVTVGQLNAYTTVWNALQTYFLRLDGTTPMGGALQMGSNKITGLGNGVAAQDAVTKAQLDLKLSLTGGTMSGAIAMGGQLITGLAAGVSPTDAVNLAQAQSLVAGFATLVPYQAAGTFAFVVPAGISKIRTESWGGGGGGMSQGGAAPRSGGAGAGYATAVLTVTPGETLTITVGAGGAGGAAPTAGGASKITRIATDLVTANGGAAGSTAVPTGGTVAFDGTVSGFGINGQIGEFQMVDNDSGGDTDAGWGGSAPRGGSGGKGFSTSSNPAGTSTYTSGIAPGGGGGAGDGVGAGSGAAGAVLISY